MAHCQGCADLQAELQEVRASLARVTQERDEERAIVDRIWKALGIVEFDNGPEISERVVALRAAKDAASARADRLADEITDLGLVKDAAEAKADALAQRLARLTGLVEKWERSAELDAFPFASTIYRRLADELTTALSEGKE